MNKNKHKISCRNCWNITSGASFRRPFYPLLDKGINFSKCMKRLEMLTIPNVCFRSICIHRPRIVFIVSLLFEYQKMFTCIVLLSVLLWQEAWNYPEFVCSQVENGDFILQRLIQWKWNNKFEILCHSGYMLALYVRVNFIRGNFFYQSNIASTVLQIVSEIKLLFPISDFCLSANFITLCSR